MKVYTKKGDLGNTGLYRGQRVKKDSHRIQCNGDIDEAQAWLGVARSESNDVILNEILISLERDLWIVMADIATTPNSKAPKVEGVDKVSGDMVLRIEKLIDETSLKFEVPKEFVVPGETRLAALLDVARTVIRRGERSAVSIGMEDSSYVIPYINRLSDLVWTLARWQEGVSLKTKYL